MRKLEKFLIFIYFAVCPVELALHLVIQSTTKYVGLLIVLVWGLMILANNDDISIYYTNHTLSFALWLIYCIITLIWTKISVYSYDYLITYLEMGLLYFVCVEIRWTEKDVCHFLYAILLGSISVAILVYFFGEARFVGRTVINLLGKYCDPNQLAANIIPGALVAVWIMLDKKKPIIITNI